MYAPPHSIVFIVPEDESACESQPPWIGPIVGPNDEPERLEGWGILSQQIGNSMEEQAEERVKERDEQKRVSNSNHRDIGKA